MAAEPVVVVPTGRDVIVPIRLFGRDDRDDRDDREQPWLALSESVRR